MKIVWGTFVLICLGLFVVIHLADPTNLKLKIIPGKPRLHNDIMVPMRVEISNYGPRSVSLVLPGGGSDIGLQSPFTSWEFRTASGDLWTPMPEGRCGNFLNHKVSDFFTILPGQTQQFETGASVLGIKPGNYQVRFFFRNQPPAPGKTPRPSDPKVETLMQNTLRCNLTSNWVSFSVR